MLRASLSLRMESPCLTWVWELNVGGMEMCYEITVTCTFGQIIASRWRLTTFSLQQIPRGVLDAGNGNHG